MTSQPISPVQQQYEMLPYPPVDPQDERHRLMHTWLDHLPMVNHYCFAGRQSFNKGFRVLVAGGGTGSATVFLAEQLKGTDARIVHLDFSAASMEIARQRAQIRGLDNIDWVLDSILNLPQLGLQPFDYINCSGVLHHLADPDAGLRALMAVLKQEGAMGLMVYARHGRTGIYQIQELMRRVNQGETSIAAQLDNARQLLAVLPPSNWFMRCEDLWRGDMVSDADLYDIVLHSQDRAYTVEELFSWLVDGHGLSLAFSAVGKGRSAYLPRLALRGAQPTPVLAKMEQQPLRAQYAMAELLSGNIMTHVFYATRAADCQAAYGDANLVPFFYNEPLIGPQVAEIFNQNGGKPFWLDHKHIGVTTVVRPGRHAAQVLQHIDGERTFQQIFDKLRAEPANRHLKLSNQLLFDDFQSSFDVLNAIERMLLRHPEVAA
jgi:ubiquinone/menaquinone biosynthesis C-methylase UbiE